MRIRPKSTPVGIITMKEGENKINSFTATGDNNKLSQIA